MLRACAYCMKGSASIHSDTHDVKRLKALVLDGGDESEDQLFVCKLCRAAYFCSVACQRSAWKLHRAPCSAHCEAGLVAAVEMRSAADCRQVYLAADDPRIEAATESPVMQRCGIPLALFSLHGHGRAENEWCQRLMMDPLTGVTAAAHRSVGAALVVRRDRMPVTPQHVYQLGEFFALLAERFEDDDDADAAAAMMTQARFVAFLADHVRIGGRQKHVNEMGVSW